jgi:NDP-4-keto-2,6-dideoxyhexose 3-C-methyltransferase
MTQEITSVRSTCRVCSSTSLQPILSLGDEYVTDFIKDPEADKELKKFPLDLVLCNKSAGGCGLLQLKHTVSRESITDQYWYFSGINATMVHELNGIAATVEVMVPLSSGDYVIDIGANDGTLLRGYATKGLNRIGYEPAKNMMELARQGTTTIFNAFFNYGDWQAAFGDAKAKAITAIAMFYDLEDPNIFINDVAKCLHKDGVFIIQMMYLVSMLEKNVVDNISHEHLEYYSLLPLENLLARHGLEVCDVELNDINCGSFRIYIRHRSAGQGMKVSEGAEKRVREMREKEEKMGLDTKTVYDEFAERVYAARDALMTFVRKEVAGGKKVYVYGASNKGNTLLQFYGLDSVLIRAAAERNPRKFGLYTVGTHIPIISEEQARKEKPDYFLVLPWGFMEEFVKREEDFLRSGGKFIVPLPQAAVIGKEGTELV